MMSTTSRRWIFAAASTAVAALIAFAPAANAAKGGGGKGGGGGTSGTSSMTLVMVNDQNANGLPNWGDSIRFNVSTTATDKPYVDVLCSQGGHVVYSATTGYFSSYPWPWTQTMTLSSNSWTGGDASCNAQLYSMSNSGNRTTLYTMNFQAYA